jgi:DNA-binding Lrp family transcriptional regulator
MEKNTWQAWVWIKWKPGTDSTAWEGWKNHPQIKSAWSTLGTWDCVLTVNVTDPEELETFVWKTIRKNTWVEDTSTTWAKQWW